MTDEQITVVPEAESWGLSEEQEKAAEVLADGGRFWEAAKAAKVDIRTITRWTELEHFATYAIQLRQAIRATRRAKREKVVRLALDVSAKVLDGSISAGSAQAKYAADILRQTEWRTWESEPADSWVARTERARIVDYPPIAASSA